jgi:hypothetical protein
MVNRILIDANNFKVSKPGVDVLSAGSGDLLLDNTKTSMGVSEVGSVGVTANSGWLEDQYQLSQPELYWQSSDTTEAALSNTTTNVPVVTLQRKDGSSAWGLGHYHHVNGSVGSIPGVFGGPPSYFLTTEIDETKTVYGLGCRFRTSVSTVSIDPYTSGTYYYLAYYNDIEQAAAPPPGSNDVTPNAINFTNSSSTTQTVQSNSQQILGIDTGITISFTTNANIASGENFYIVRDRTSGSTSDFVIPSGSNSVNIPIVNGDTLTIVMQSNVNRIYTTTVRNVSDSNTVLDTVTLEANEPVASTNFGTASGTNYGTTSTDTMTAATTSSNTLNLTTALSGEDYVIVFVGGVRNGPFRNTSSISFTANSTANVQFAFYSYGSYSTSFTVVNNGATVGIGSASISSGNLVPSNALDWGLMFENTSNETAFVASNSQTVSGLGSTKTFRVSLTGSGTIDFTLSAVVNGSSVAAINGPSGSMDFSCGNASLQFFGSVGSANTFYTGTAIVYVLIGGTQVFLDEFPISIQTGSGGGGGPFLPPGDGI